MNKIYKLVWNASSGCWSVASEFARKGKPGRGARRLILATSLLTVSGAGMAATFAEQCTTDDSSTPKTITCKNNISKATVRYVIPTPDTVMVVPEGTNIELIGVAKLFPTTILGNDNPLENNSIINNGNILWTEASGYHKKMRPAVVLNLYANNINSASFHNGKNGKVAIEMYRNGISGNYSTAVAFISADSGKPVLNNEGEMSITSPGKVSDNDFQKQYGGYVRGKNPEITNSGTVTIQAFKNISGFGLATSAKGGQGSLINTGKVEVSSEAGVAVGVIAFGDNTSTSTLDNQGTITVSTTTGEASGAYSSVSGNITINNQSNITATATESGIARGISANGDNTSTSTLDNQGTITVS
ncbi:ESPR domain-containing protein, partial [Escherichia coli]